MYSAFRPLLTLIFLSLPTLADPAAPADKLPDQITLAATHWCPYSCDPQQTAGRSGIISEYLTELLARHQVRLEIRFLPWSRALAQARGGVVDGLLTAVPDEAPELTFVDSATAFYQDCFYVAENSDWQYQSAASLDAVRLAYIKDYGYDEPLASHIKQSANTLEVLGSEASQRMALLVRGGRAQAMVEDHWVARWEQQNGRHNTQLKNAGCLQKNPFYLAFNSDKPYILNLLKLLNKELADAANQQRLQQLARPYLNSTSGNRASSGTE